ncbi:hypothetical protein [Paraliobacillus zengyii]|uniref:hypothetical protein n=1 Tax=Paraliobacillus TaxID=200903 RepID=UPI002FCD92CB
MDYQTYWENIYDKNEALNELFRSYWHAYSSFGTWQFWIVVLFFLSPLVLLYFKVDRKRIFEVFFFGYTVHMLWTYAEIILSRHGFFVHTYFLTPFIPYAQHDCFRTTSSFFTYIPVLYE